MGSISATCHLSAREMSLLEAWIADGRILGHFYYPSLMDDAAVLGIKLSARLIRTHAFTSIAIVEDDKASCCGDNWRKWHKGKFL